MTYADADLEILWQRAFLRCRAAGASTEDAHDCAQDAITELFAHSDVEHPKAWVATVAFHRYIDLCRRHGRERCVGLAPVPTTGEAEQPGPEEQVVGRAHANWLVSAMKSWPASTRAVCSTVATGMSRLEISNRLGLTHRAVESHLTRARRLLRGLSLLGGVFAVMLGRAIRRIAPAVKPLTTAALLMPSVAVILILGGGEPAPGTRGAAVAAQPAQPRQHPAQPAPVTSNPPSGTASSQAPTGSPPPTTPGPATPPTSTGLPGLKAPATPDTPDPSIQLPPIEQPSIQLPPIQLPSIQLPVDIPVLPPLPLPAQLPALPATPPLPSVPGQLIPPEAVPDLVDDVEAQLPIELPG